MLKRVLLSVVAALLAGFVAFRAAFGLRYAHLAALYPRDGQIGLDAIMVGLIASIAAASLAFLAVWMVTKNLIRNER